MEQKKSYDDITVILPTLNEEGNISNIILYLAENYPGCKIIVTDDGSTDKTKEQVSSVSCPGLIFLDRTSKKVHGLTVSVLDAIELVQTKYFIVMDADGQHPPQIVHEIVSILRFGARIVIGSRVQIEEDWGIVRKVISYCGALIGKAALLSRGKNYMRYDILGGLFGCMTDFWKKAIPFHEKIKRFRLRGYKILFDFLKYAPSRLVIEEVYYNFQTRKAGVSKINLKVYWEYLMSCIKS